jgi:hypothetical protein
MNNLSSTLAQKLAAGIFALLCSAVTFAGTANPFA